MTAPASHIPKEGRPFQGRRAGLASPGMAGTLDGFVLVALLAGSYCAWAVMVFLWNPSGFRFPTPSRLLVLVAGRPAAAHVGRVRLADGTTVGAGQRGR
jgi:hypothetical protein